MSNLNQQQHVEELSLVRQTQVNNVLRLLRHSLDKLRITLIIPKFFENFISTEQRLYDSKYKSCIDLVEDYIRDKNMNGTETSPYLNYRLIKLIDFLHENNQVLDYFNDWLDDLSPVDKSLIDSFQLLLMVTEQRLKNPAISELNKEKTIHAVYEENERIKTKVRVLQALLKSQRISLTWKLAVQSMLYKKYQRDLAKYKYGNNIRIKQEIYRSSHNIRQMLVLSVSKQKELDEELDRNKVIYERLLKENLIQERSARDEKNKLLLQLEALLKKFDQTMTAKFRENMDLQEEFKKRKESFDLFLIEYNREDAQYDRIVRSKEKEEKIQREKKILFFMLNRSARIIQKRWRKFLRAKKRALKKLTGRGKSKKK